MITLLAALLVTDTHFNIQSNIHYLGWLGLDNWHAEPHELISTMIYHAMHAAVDNLATTSEYNQSNLGELLYKRFSKLLCLIENNPIDFIYGANH
ncbi:hypothetical protein LDO51_03500 [Providencia alcalifaciens]|uniref:hypothetical protein n=1 Tax=Providencia alcalifaciens TaxID=126385 RepID=UPI001CE09AD4|nr:hypothetical protein [Providencia alcalifaciens]UBX49900.1 hypothetical protein LDO51_03500 [Providencia alcalifaciens]